MTRELLYAFTQLYVSERQDVLRKMGYKNDQHGTESNIDYCTRVVRQICNDGKVRELEQEMREYQ